MLRNHWWNLVCELRSACAGRRPATTGSRTSSTARPWVRTVRPGLAPSELVVPIALRNTLPQFLAC
jgi:hypothetical protein